MAARCGDALLVIDGQRRLRYANPAARRLLGYGPDEPVGGRCRATTRGTDCEDACPVTWALENGLDAVEDFPTRYVRTDGTEVPLRVTAVIVRDGEGRFVAALELLRPDHALGSWVLEGASAAAERLRLAVRDAAAADLPVWVAGAAEERLEVARAVHRTRGLPEARFVVVRRGGRWLPSWPPGTVYVEAGEGAAPDPEDLGPWRLVVGADVAPASGWPGTVIVVPPAPRRGSDLEAMVRAWLAGRAPESALSSDTVSRIAALAARRGLGEALAAAERALAGGLPEEAGALAGPDGGALPLGEILAAEDPLGRAEAEVVRAVLERCGWRVGEAATRLGVSRVTLWRKLKQHGIERPVNRS